jgi:hypothetical protein
MWLVWIIGGVVVFLALILLGGILANFGRAVYQERAKELFRLQKQRLEERFAVAAAASGKPRGLRWKELQWSETVQFVRDHKSGQIGAIVGVTIQFEAIEGGDMEDVPAVQDAKNASALFLFDKGAWHATGKAFFNLNPDEAAARFENQFERLEG